MSLMKYTFINVITTLLRVFPFPCKTGLMKIGNPNRNSLVFLTCNYLLTLERVKRALKGIDAYLLVANSRGINIWCASAGGQFTNHEVISAITVSGIEEFVDHKNVILPQLSATGVEAKVIQKKTGWRVKWGPVYAKDIPLFIENNCKKTPEMREVRFPWTDRVEMAVFFAFPLSIILALIVLPFLPSSILPLIVLVWGLSFLILLSFPLYSRWLRPEGKSTDFIRRTGFPILLWGVFIIGLIIYRAAIGDFTWGFIVQWGVIPLVTVLLLSIDLAGISPTYKAALHEELKIALDEKKCKGAAFCEKVCPRDCYEVDSTRHIATMPRSDRCVQCGACIIQCPFDALYFKTPKDEIIPPETIRRFKLNLTSKRLVKVEGK